MSDESDDDGGVKLDTHDDKPSILKQGTRDLHVKRKQSEDPSLASEQSGTKRLKTDVEQHDVNLRKHASRFDSEPTSKVRQKKAEGRESESNPYLAPQYEGSEKKGPDPRSNPYLAHMYEEDESYNGYSNGYGKSMNRTNGVSDASTLVRLPRHKTTAAMARKSEDGPDNAFSGKPLSTQYFNILKTRRNLPVHAQR